MCVGGGGGGYNHGVDVSHWGIFKRKGNIIYVSFIACSSDVYECRKHRITVYLCCFLSLPSVDVVLDNLVVTGQLEEENREKVREALLIRHRHQNSDIDILRHIRSFADFRKGSHLKKPDGSEDSTSLHHDLEVPPTLGGKTLLISRGCIRERYSCLQEQNEGRVVFCPHGCTCPV